MATQTDLNETARAKATARGVLLFFGGVLVGVLLIITAYYLSLPEKSEVVAETDNAIEEVAGSPTEIENQADQEAKPEEVQFSDDSTHTLYQNVGLGFSLKYPKDWQLKTGAGNNYDKSVITLTSPETLANPNSGVPSGESYLKLEELSVYYYETLGDEIGGKLNGRSAKTLDELIENDSTITRLSDITINGLPAVEVLMAGHYSSYAVLIENKGHLYKLYFTSAWEKKDLTAEQIQIRDSFQILP